MKLEITVEATQEQCICKNSMKQKNNANKARDQVGAHGTIHISGGMTSKQLSMLHHISFEAFKRWNENIVDRMSMRSHTSILMLYYGRGVTKSRQNAT
jgi:intracellular sulfur oxidation DsrE/DsrF family protein